MAKWGKIGGRGRRARYFDAHAYCCLYMQDGEIMAGAYRTAQPIATEVDEAVQGFLDGVAQINVPNDKKFCAAVREHYAAVVVVKSSVPAEVQL